MTKNQALGMTFSSPDFYLNFAYLGAEIVPKVPSKVRFKGLLHFFYIFLPKNLVMSKKSSTFAPAFERQLLLVR